MTKRTSEIETYTGPVWDEYGVADHEAEPEDWTKLKPPKGWRRVELPMLEDVDDMLLILKAERARLLRIRRLIVSLGESIT